jgi:hypothetical protein
MPPVRRDRRRLGRRRRGCAGCARDERRRRVRVGGARVHGAVLQPQVPGGDRVPRGVGVPAASLVPALKPYRPGEGRPGGSARLHKRVAQARCALPFARARRAVPRAASDRAGPVHRRMGGPEEAKAAGVGCLGVRIYRWPRGDKRGQTVARPGWHLRVSRRHPLHGRVPVSPLRRLPQSAPHQWVQALRHSRRHPEVGRRRVGEALGDGTNGCVTAQVSNASTDLKLTQYPLEASIVLRGLPIPVPTRTEVWTAE